MKTYHCRYIDRDLVSDGDLSKPEWKRAEEVELVDNCTGKPPRQSTRARLLWNENYFFRFSLY